MVTVVEMPTHNACTRVKSQESVKTRLLKTNRRGDRGQMAAVLQEKELLELVRHFLEEEGLVEAMRCVEKASQSSQKGQELVFLRELVLNGQWNDVIKYLSPLKTLNGYLACCYQLYKQEYLELLTSKEKIDDLEAKLCKMLTRLKSITSCEEEFSSLLFLLTVPDPTIHCEKWTRMGGRLALFHHISDFLTCHLVTPTLKRNQRKHRLAQLVTKGLLYERCETVCSARHGITLPEDDRLLNLYEWIEQQPASSFMSPPGSMQIATLAHSTKMARKIVPAAPTNLMSSSMVVPGVDEEQKEAEPTVLSCSAPQSIHWTRSISAREPTVHITNQLNSTDIRPLVDFTPEILPLPPGKKSDFSTPKANQRETPPLQPISSPVPYYTGTHGTPYVRKCPQEERDAQTQFPKATLASMITDPQVIRSVSFSSQLDMLAVGTNSRVLHVYSVSSLLEDNAISCRSLPLLYQQPGYHRGSIYCLAWWKDSLLASGSNDQTIRLLSHSPDKHFTSQGLLAGFKSTVREVVFMPSGLLLSCGVGGNGLRLSDCQQKCAVQTFHGHSSQILAVTSLDEHRFASGGEDATVKLWDVRCSSSPTSSLSLPHAVTSLSSHNNLLACSTTAGTCHMVDMSSDLSLQNTFSPSKDECRSIRYSPNGSWILTGSYSGEAGLAHSSSFLWQSICNHTDKVIQCRWHTSGCLIATAGADKTARVWKLH